MFDNEILLGVAITIFVVERSVSMFTTIRSNGDIKLLIEKLNMLIEEIRLERLTRKD